MVYAGFGAVIVIVIAVIGGINLYNQHAQQAAQTQANATPTPGPNAKAPPIQLSSTGVGRPAFPNPIRSNPHNGAPVDGITCTSTEQVTLHIHSHLAIFANGKQLQVPAGVGIAPVPPQGCLYWIHTHDATGIIHIEAPQFEAPGGGHFTLGSFFDIWGQPLARDDVAGKRGAVTAYVNGALWPGDLRAIPLISHQEITLEVGKPLVPPPNYAFPFGD